uniref:Uncharacterized protein n=1 Tax=Piliocolobus tephrosceles TaxID=591936 RepID=A0A8C9I9X9_9PRIM
MYAWHWAGCCHLSEYDQCSARASLGPDHQGVGPCGQPLPPGRPGTGAAGRGRRAQLLGGTGGGGERRRRAAVPGRGRAAPLGLEAAGQKLSLRGKKALSAEEMDMGPGPRRAGRAHRPGVCPCQDPGGPAEVEHGPLDVFQMLKSMCAWQRLASEPQDSGAGRVSLPQGTAPDLPLGNKGSTSLGGAVALLKCSDRKGSSQGTPRQPSATRLPTWGRPGKSPMRGST